MGEVSFPSPEVDLVMAATRSPRADLPVIIGAAKTAEILGLTKRVVYSMVAHKAFPADVLVRNGRAVYFLRLRLLEWAGLRDGDGP